MEYTTLKDATVDVIKEYWSKTYSNQGTPDWSHIFPFYSEDMIFQDTIQKIEGKEKFIEMCNRLTKRSSNLDMEIIFIVRKDNIIFMEWIMTMTFRKTRNSSIYGSTKLTLNDEGYIISQRDYYDLWGDIFDNIPLLRKSYRRFVRRLFG